MGVWWVRRLTVVRRRQVYFQGMKNSQTQLADSTHKTHIVGIQSSGTKANAYVLYACHLLRGEWRIIQTTRPIQFPCALLAGLPMFVCVYECAYCFYIQSVHEIMNRNNWVIKIWIPLYIYIYLIMTVSLWAQDEATSDAYRSNVKTKWRIKILIAGYLIHDSVICKSQHTEFNVIEMFSFDSRWCWYLIVLARLLKSILSLLCGPLNGYVWD